MIIDLKETNTKKYSSENLIQINAKEKFSKLVNSLLVFDEELISKEFTRVHNTILINGKRGMGKTSFILSMQDNKEIKNLLCPLDIIDPTLIETKEHVFLNIITSIKDEVEKYIKEKKDASNDDTSIREWEKSLLKLAGGLSMLDGIGSDHLQDSMWDSPELILEKGLSNTKQGKDLEKKFHKFIEISLIILNKKAFFLILDDIDTSLEKGISVLETIRKYLTSNKILITMLGDINLYSILVRQLQWEKIDPKQILKEYEGKDKYISQIDHLEEQYLTKVLKPENRIDLDNLLELKDEINIIDSKKRQLKLEFFLNELIDNIYLIKDNSYKKYYFETILTQSTRSVIQIFKLYDGQKDFSKVLKDTFYTTLNKKLDRFNLLDLYKKEQFLNLLSIYILKNDISRDNHLKLIPDFIDDDNNITMMYLNALSNSILKESKNYLEYFIKIGYTLEQFTNLEIKDEKEIEVKKFIEHIALDSGESTSKISKRLLTTSKIKIKTPQTPILFGAMFISNDKLEKLSNKIYTPLILSKVNSSNTGSYHFISFFNFIGFVSDISSITDENDIERVLITHSQILEFNLYENNTFDGEGDQFDEKDYQVDLKDEISIWIKWVRVSWV